MLSPVPPARVLALLGPTASGKTGMAVHLARHLPVEVISADSRQIRRGMRIGTAAPTAAERAAVRHHLVEVVEPDAPWTLRDFLAGAHAAIEDVLARGRVPLLLAGTGQYAWALLEGWRTPEVEPDPARRAELEALAQAAGPLPLYDRLLRVDEASALRIGRRNARRLIRALEIVEATGRPVPELGREPPPWPWHALGLRWPRRALYARADARVGEMFAAGLVAETRALIDDHGAEFEALRSIGYAEAARVVSGEWDVAEAMKHVRRNTHRLIRMQGRWFRAEDPRIAWVAGDDPDAVLVAARRALGGAQG